VVLSCAGAFAVALAVSYVMTPLVKRLALSLGALDRPVLRSVHSVPTPFLGGLAIYVALGGTLAVFLRPAGPEVKGILVGGALVVLLGVADDFRKLRPLTKLLGQVAAALVLVAWGVRVEWLTNPLGGMIYLGAWGVPLTVLWVVSVVNVVNLADGLDGLAAGIASIASLTAMFVALGQGQLPVVILTAALAGSALGFLPYNFNPAKIFMGDAGAMFLGYALAAVSVAGALKSATAVALGVPMLALGLPIADTSFAIVRRLLTGRPVGEADDGHLHHRLLRLGLSQRQVVLLMYTISACLGLGGILIAYGDRAQGAALLLAVVVLLYVGARKSGILEIRRNHRKM